MTALALTAMLLTAAADPPPSPDPKPVPATREEEKAALEATRKPAPVCQCPRRRKVPAG